LKSAVESLGMLAPVILAFYVGTRSISSAGHPAIVYRTETRERVSGSDLRRVVHDETTFTVISPPVLATLFPPMYGDVLISENSDRTIEGPDPRGFITQLALARRVRNFFGGGYPGYGSEHTFDTSYQRDSVARTKRESVFDVPLDSSKIRPSHPDDRKDTITVIAADGSFMRSETQMAPGGFTETQKPDGSYTFFSETPGFGYTDFRFSAHTRSDRRHRSVRHGGRHDDARVASIKRIAAQLRNSHRQHRRAIGRAC
jgi:hypothetical protein